MPSIIILPEGFKADFISAVSDVIELAGKDSCRLYYPGIQTDCPSCSPNYYTDGSSFNAFSDCATCGGRGTITTEQSETVQMTVLWNPQKWANLPIVKQMQLNKPDGFIVTRGHMRDLPKIRRAQRMKIDTNIEDAQGGSTFLLAGEPVDENGYIQGNFFSAVWRRE